MLQIFTTYLEKNGTLKIADTVNISAVLKP
jgi:hypothetical protein